jgi:hypothetical protein
MVFYSNSKRFPLNGFQSANPDVICFHVKAMEDQLDLHYLKQQVINTTIGIVHKKEAGGEVLS